MLPFKTYLHVAFIAIVCALVCYGLKMVRLPGDDVILRYPDITLHDIIYFNIENFVNLFGLIACVNLCYFISACFPLSTLANSLRYSMLLIYMFCFIRTVAHFFTYYEVYLLEYMADFLVGIVLIIRLRLLFRNLKSLKDNGTDTRPSHIYH